MHLEIPPNTLTTSSSDYVYAQLMRKGDLSSFKWIVGSLNGFNTNKNPIINVHYNAVNSRDVLLATGRISPNKNSHLKCLISDSDLGFEFSGVNENGTRIMGISTICSIGTKIVPNQFHWEIPDHWTLKQGATVPVAYLTVYLAFFYATKISEGKSILIHAGNEDIGLAAIHVALAYNLDVYTTVSSPTQKKIILNLFPKLQSIFSD